MALFPMTSAGQEILVRERALIEGFESSSAKAAERHRGECKARMKLLASTIAAAERSLAEIVEHRREIERAVAGSERRSKTNHAPDAAQDRRKARAAVDAHRESARDLYDLTNLAENSLAGLRKALTCMKQTEGTALPNPVPQAPVSSAEIEEARARAFLAEFAYPRMEDGRYFSAGDPSPESAPVVPTQFLASRLPVLERHERMTDVELLENLLRLQRKKPDPKRTVLLATATSQAEKLLAGAWADWMSTMSHAERARATRMPLPSGRVLAHRVAYEDTPADEAT